MKFTKIFILVLVVLLLVSSVFGQELSRAAIGESNAEDTLVEMRDILETARPALS